MKQLSILSLCLLVLVVAGCADPAKDKPQAVVEEAAPTQPEPAAAAVRYELGDGTTIGFVGSKITGSHEGGFRGFDGEVLVVDGDPTQSVVKVNIDATSLWADNDKLTNHLKSADFFGVETYSTAAFESTEIASEDAGYRMTGNLTLHGVTKSISFPATISVDETQVRAQAEFAIKRFDFGIVYPGRKDDLIRDDVVIKLDLVATPAAEAGAEAG